MGKWLRKDAACKRHPKFVLAGFWGGVVTDAVWEIAKLFDCDGGDISQFWTAEYICSHLNGGPEEVEGVRAGMQRAVDCGLINVTQDNRVLIHDWDEYQRRAAQAEKAARKRDARGTRGGREGDIKETPGGCEGDANGQTGRDVTGRDKSKPRDPSTTNTSLPKSIPCPNCSEPLMLKGGSNGKFYGHGYMGGHLGCRTTVDVEMYRSMERVRAEQAAARPKLTLGDPNS